MIYSCPVCRTLHEMGSDHRATEPCAPCYRNGWRDDGCGNLHRRPQLSSYERANTGIDARACRRLIDGLKRTQ